VKIKLIAIAFLAASTTGTPLFAQDPAHDDGTMAGCPMHAQHVAGVDERGDKGMGFSHTKTTHHFRLMNDGGAIEVTANDPKDEASRSQIRGHLAHVAQQFSQGNFELPMFVHDKMPDGATTMQQLKTRIAYRYEEMETGGRVRITTADPQALAAVHEFLRFQITEHRTGDPIQVAAQ
jgi:TusA-related sulfurtransferase